MSKLMTFFCLFSYFLYQFFCNIPNEMLALHQQIEPHPASSKLQISANRNLAPRIQNLVKFDKINFIKSSNIQTVLFITKKIKYQTYI